ncbi:MAG: electron transport complex subunit E [Defluviitaleaceae bacterium]|nr:electron transport complex subunit E [Defluviitaleaceae bacterium]
MKPLKILLNGVWYENPIFVQAIALCPALAVSTTAVNAIGMGLATAVVLIFSNITISLVHRFIPNQVRIPCFIVIIAGFVTVLQFGLEAYFPALNHSLGIFIPLIVVNCILLARAESFAASNNALWSAADGLCTGLGFTAALTFIGAIREFFGSGTFFGVSVLPAWFPLTVIIILPPGAFFTLGALIAGMNVIKKRRRA